MWCRRSVISSSHIFCRALIWSQCGGCQSVYIFINCKNRKTDLILNRLWVHLLGINWICFTWPICSSQDVSFQLLVMGPSQLTAMLFVGMVFTVGEFPTFPLWWAPHSWLPCPLSVCSSQWVSSQLFPCDGPLTAHCHALCRRALHSGWVPNFPLVMGPSQLTAMPFVGVLFTGCEFPTFPLWWAPHSSLSCPLSACSSQQVSFWGTP